jgi:hypothetical protein
MAGLAGSREMFLIVAAAVAIALAAGLGARGPGILRPGQTAIIVHDYALRISRVILEAGRSAREWVPVG